MPPYRQREWVSQSEWRKRKRAKAKARLEEQRQVEAERQEELEQIKRRVEAIAAGNKPQGENVTSLSTKLWAWGVNSEKHPTYAMGVFPTIIMYLVVVPVLGLLYKLSFTWLAPVMIVGAGLIALLFQKIKR